LWKKLYFYYVYVKSLIGSPEKCWLVYVALLAAHQFNVSLILLNDGFPAAAE
jgi:hypothetical protein